jgi:hypothetical protein
MWVLGKLKAELYCRVKVRHNQVLLHDHWRYPWTPWLCQKHDYLLAPPSWTAVIMIDSTLGGFEAGICMSKDGQTREHALLAFILAATRYYCCSSFLHYFCCVTFRSSTVLFHSLFGLLEWLVSKVHDHYYLVKSDATFFIASTFKWHGVASQVWFSIIQSSYCF